MIPKYLRFQSFASYKNEQIIDFEKLGQNEIFLIHGKTGSGKTSILDAITYVLYGKSTSDSRGELESMRCRNFGANRIPTEIEFIFEVKGKKYKFFRSVFDRVNRNGKINTEYDYNCYFEENGIFVPFFDNPTKTKVTEKAEEIIGLNFNQFMQVVILPQGKFESFLVAPSKTKEEILNTLFRIDNWNEIGQWLCDRATEMERKNRDEKVSLEEKLKSVECSDKEQVREEILLLCEKQKQTKTLCSELEKEIEAQKKILDAETEIQKLFSQKEAVEKRLAELSSQSEEINKAKQRLVINSKAKKVSPHYEKYLSLKNECEGLKAEFSALSERVLKTEADFSKSNQHIEELKHQEQSINADRQNLTRLLSLEKPYSQYNDIKSEEIFVGSDKITLEKKLSSLKSDFNLILSQRSEKSSLREEIFSLYQPKVTELKDKISLLEQSKKLSDEIEKFRLHKQSLVQELGRIVEKSERISSGLLSKKDEKAKKYSLHISFLAQNLAHELKDGQPCPVCGSIHHPSVVKDINYKSLEKELVTIEEDIRVLENELSALTQKQSELTLRIEHGDKLIEEKLEELKPLPSFSEDEYKRISNEYAEARKKADCLPELNKNIAELDNKSQSMSEIISSTETALSHKQQQHVQICATLKVLNEQLDADIPDLKSLLEKTEALKKKIADFESDKENAEKKANELQKILILEKAKAEQKNELLNNNLKKLALIETKFYEELANNGFADLSEFISGRLSEDDEEQLEKFCIDYDIELKTAHNDMEMVSTLLGDKEYSDTEPLRIKLSETQAQRDTLVKELALTAEKAERFTSLLSDYEKREAKLFIEIENARRLKYFGQELRGDRGVGLRRYVLGIMLENVIFEANRLLEGVKGGQFKLYNVVSDSENKATGLDLMIGSNKAESLYSVSALSGGEKFLVAISLSIALSTVVQMQAGGVSIEAMFIDEGFGSLDPEALDEAMEILQSMKGSRRFLGIISHVESMKETIPNKLEVINAHEGSSVKITI